MKGRSLSMAMSWLLCFPWFVHDHGLGGRDADIAPYKSLQCFYARHQAQSTIFIAPRPRPRPRAGRRPSGTMPCVIPGRDLESRGQDGSGVESVGLGKGFRTKHYALSSFRTVSIAPSTVFSPDVVRPVYIYLFSVFSVPSVVIFFCCAQGTRRCMAARGTCRGAGGVVQGMEGGRCCYSGGTFRWPCVCVCFTASVRLEARLLW